jgi:hypothetical protein
MHSVSFAPIISCRCPRRLNSLVTPPARASARSLLAWVAFCRVLASLVVARLAAGAPRGRPPVQRAGVGGVRGCGSIWTKSDASARLPNCVRCKAAMRGGKSRFCHGATSHRRPIITRLEDAKNRPLRIGIAAFHGLASENVCLLPQTHVL